MLTEILPLISDMNDFVRMDQIKRIGVKKVLAHLWNEGRMKDCLARLKTGEKAPPIHVCGYLLHDCLWYIVSDGNHRTLAARELGRTQITARVGGITICKPNLYKIHNHVLWRYQGYSWLQIQTGLSKEIEQALIKAGVK